MSLKIYLTGEHNKFFVKTLPIHTREVIPVKMLLQAIIVEIVYGLTICSVADKTSFVTLSAVNVKLILPIESLFTKPAIWMSFETGLVLRAWVIISFSQMQIEFLIVV